MTDIKISTVEEDKKEPTFKDNDIKETLRAADEYKKIKEENDKLEAEISRQQELKSKLAMGGRAMAGQIEKSPEEIAEEEAKKIISIYR